MLLAQLKLVHEQVKAVDRGIAELLEELPAALGEAGDEGDGEDSLTRLLSMKGGRAGGGGRAVRGSERPSWSGAPSNRPAPTSAPRRSPGSPGGKRRITNGGR